jgi:CTP:molybdopterin cytidylyltransferase MocA
MMAAIILAAGRSTRMGQSKPLLRYGGPAGHTFVAQLVEVLKTSGFSEILVVGRPEDDQLQAETGRCGATFISNPDADRGQLSSLQVALTALETAQGAGPDAVMVIPADAPLISSAAVTRLLLAADQSDAQILRATHQGRHGHPVVFRRTTFAELHGADPEVGARAVVRADPARVLDVDVEEAGVTIDFDTPDQYQRHFGRSPFSR